MGKDHDVIQAVKDRDPVTLNKILTKVGKQTKNKILGSSKKFNINYQDGDGMCALHQASLIGNLEMMQLLLENGSSVSIQDNKGMLALHYAAWQGKSEPVHLLLQWQSPVNEQACEGETPLHLACQHGHFDVVNLLLLHHANPTVINKDYKTPLDLACEFGRYRVVDLLLRSNLCASLLADSPNDMKDNNRTTCLHLAAKNGHIEIIRLLLQAGVNINRSTLRGTCLHEAALCGKTDVVKLLLDCGVDVNRANSYDQTALDIVTTYTTTRAARDLKQLLKEASFAVKARAIKDYCDIYNTKSIAFREGDIIKVIEQGEDVWKGVVISDHRRMSKPGYFPPDHVVLIDSTANHLMSNRRVPSMPSMPQVPDLLSRSPGFTNHSQYCSVGADHSFPPPPSTLVSCNSPFKDVHSHVHHYQDNSALHITGQHAYSNYNDIHVQNVNGRVYENHVGEPNQNHLSDWSSLPPYSAVVNDLRTASPAKGSPTNSNRNSAASSDSGRGYSTGHIEPKVTHNYANVQINNQHRLSGQSYESGVSSRQSYHSTSSSSVGSLDRLEESGYSSQVNVADLFQTGLPDHEVLRCWLRELRFEDYYNNFIAAGYDMPTVSRMTPEDLTAIGITKPGHRKRLKAEIARLNIHDGIPDYKPNTVMDWLRLLRLEQYFGTLTNQGYDNIDYLTDITWEDLEEIGIQKLGHQKKIMLAIERLKRIISGVKRLSSMDSSKRGSGEVLEPPPVNNNSRWSAGEVMSTSLNTPEKISGGIPFKSRRSSSGESHNSAIDFPMSSPLHHRHSSESSMDSCFPPPSPSSMSYQPDVVAIQVKRSSSQSVGSGSFQKEAKDMAGHTITYQSFQVPANQRSSDSSDRESTPTGDDMYHGSPKSPTPVVAPLVPKAVIKPKPVAKIIAKTKRTSREGSPDIIDLEKHEIEKNQDICRNLSQNNQYQKNSDHIYDTPQTNNPKSPTHNKNFNNFSQSPKQIHLTKGNSNNGTVEPIFVSLQSEVSSVQQHSPQQGSPNSNNKTRKVPPPPPPKRTNSISQRSSAELSSVDAQNLKSQQFAGSIPKSAMQTPPQSGSKPEQQQVGEKQQAFANCVQSLSEKFGRKRGESCSEETGGSDGEEFPPPPPPVAMDIITPKLHNYGIPTKSEKSSMGSEYRHQGKVKQEPQSVTSTVASHSVVKTTNDMASKPVPTTADGGDNGGNIENVFGVKLRTSSQQPTVSVTASTQAAPPRSVPTTLNTVRIVSQNGSVVGSVSHSVSHTSAVVSQSGVSHSVQGHDNRRKDSNSSLELNSSTASIDSNTLPFANENVGTIKQRTPTTKPSVVLMSEDFGEAPSGMDINPHVFRGNNRVQQNLPSGVTTNTVSANQRPVVSHQEIKKPAVPRKPALQHNSARQTQSGDVLNDIDSMLQGLTDELDAMLEEEMLAE